MKPKIKQNIDDLFQLSAQMANLTIDVTKPPAPLTACKIDGTTDDYAALTAILAYAKSLNNRIKIIFPYTGNTMLISDTVHVSFGNIVLEFYCNVHLTSTSAKDAFLVKDVGNALLQNVTFVGNNITIDGNGRNVVGFTYDTVTFNNIASCVRFQGINNLKVDGITFYNGLVESCVIHYCLNGVVNQCQFNNSLYDNGLSIYGALPEDIDINDPTTWNNIRVTNCMASNCVDMGFTSNLAIGVTFENCTAYNCGNYSDSGQYNKGAGFSCESNSYRDYVAKLVYKNCKAVSCIGRGWYIDTNDVYIDEDCECINIINAVKDTVNLSDPTFLSKIRNYGGNGFCVLTSSHDITIQGKIDCEGIGVSIIGNSTYTLKDSIVKNVTIKNAKYNGIFATDIEHLILKDVHIDTVGDTYTTDGHGIYIFQDPALYNTGSVTMENINIKNVEVAGISVLYVNDIEVDGLNINTAGSRGVYFKGYNYLANESMIKNLNIKNTQHSAIYVEGYVNVILDNINTLSVCLGAGNNFPIALTNITTLLCDKLYLVKGTSPNTLTGIIATSISTSQINNLSGTVDTLQNVSSTAKKSISIGDGGWNTQHLVMGYWHLWVDGNNKLRKKNGAPTSDLEGTIVGTES